MSWRDLLPKPGETMVLPWLGGRSLRSGERVWDVEGRLPRQHGWYQWDVAGKKLSNPRDASSDETILHAVVSGYLIGDRFVVDGANVNPEPAKIAEQSESVLLLEPGLDRFARVLVGRVCEGGELLYVRQTFPLGPEDEVLAAFRRRAPSVEGVKDVTPALDAAFRMESWQRSEAERRREEIERQRREEEERRAQEERRAHIAQTLGTGVGRRQMAVVDFAEAARAALAAGGAVFVDHRQAPQRGEMVVVFSVDRRQFECVCDAQQLRIIDSGICLTSHATGTKYDDRLTLESLPGVIRQAIREGKLVVFRHVGGEDYDRDDYED